MPKLVFHDSDGIDRTIDLGAETTLIGRATECQVQTQDAMVSRRHARIVWDGGYWIEDLGSSNGVYVGNERVQKSPLRPGDEVRCGSLVLKLIPDLGRGAAAPAVAVDPLLHSANRRMTGNFAAQPAGAPPAAPDYGAPPPYEPPPALAPDEEFGAPPAYEPPPPYEPPQSYDDEPPPPPPSATAPAPNQRRSPPPATSTPPPGGPVSPEAHAERSRRIAAEAAVLTAEQRAATAEGKLYEYEQQISDLTTRCNAAEAQTQLAMKKSTDLETTAREGDRWRRQVDQLKADIRRLRGGAPVEEPEVKEVGGGDASAIAAERDRLRQRVTDLEGEVSRLEAGGGGRGPQLTGPVDIQVPGGGDAALRRKVDQLTAEIRRLRGGAPPSDDSARVADLEARLAKAEADRDAAMARSENTAAQPAADGGETSKLKRMLEQLTAENRRLRAQVQGGAPPAGDDPRVADLEAKLSKAEADLAAARAKPAGGGAVDPAAAGAAESLNDALSDLRGSLRAASDEIGVLGVEAPGDSVTVLKDALTAANEQLESARNQIKNLKKALKLP